jgi:hypothetical protein
MEGTILHVECNNTNTFAVLHDQVECEVLDEEVSVVTEGLAIKSVEESMTGTVSSGCAAVCLTTLSVLQRLTTKGTLINFSFLRPGERHTVVLKLRTCILIYGKCFYVWTNLDNGSRCFTTHVVNCILVTKPI